MCHTTPPTRDARKFWIQKISAPNKTNVADSLCGWVWGCCWPGLATWHFWHTRGYPRQGFSPKSGLVCAWFFSLSVRVLLGKPGEPDFSGNLPAQPSENVNMKENYFLNPRNYFLNPRNYILNSRNCFLNLGNYCLIKFLKLFLKSQKQFLSLGTKLRNHSKNKVCFYHLFTTPNHWTRIAVNQVNHAATKRERLPGRWCRHPSFSFIPCSLTPHLIIRHGYLLLNL